MAIRQCDGIWREFGYFNNYLIYQHVTLSVSKKTYIKALKKEMSLKSGLLGSSMCWLKITWIVIVNVHLFLFCIKS